MATKTHGGAMGEPAMAEDDIDVTDDAGADVPADNTADLDTLLAEFERATGAQQQTPVDQVDQNARDQAFADNLNAITEGYAIDARKAELQTAEQQLRVEYDRRDAAEAFKEIRGSLSADFFDDSMIDAWVASRALKDNGISQAWAGRQQNPRAYQAALDRLASEFQNQYSRLPDPQATEDHEAVAQAVRGSGKVPPEPPPDLSKMSNAELRKYTQDNWGFS
jgi:hypothetical protein